MGSKNCMQDFSTYSRVTECSFYWGMQIPLAELAVCMLVILVCWLVRIQVTEIAF